MFDEITPEHSDALDVVIRSRRSVRAFSSIPLGREAVEAIIEAGLLAPFAALAVAGTPDFRKVFVMRNSSKAMKSASDMLKQRMACVAAELEEKFGLAPFVLALQQMSERGVPGLAHAPYYIVVGERKGLPPVAAQSLCYCLETMWLKATSLGIGLQLVSATMQMGDDPAFCALLGIPAGDYALDGCLLGYPSPDYEPPEVQYPSADASVIWL